MVYIKRILKLSLLYINENYKRKLLIYCNLTKIQIVFIDRLPSDRTVSMLELEGGFIMGREKLPCKPCVLNNISLLLVILCSFNLRIWQQNSTGNPWLLCYIYRILFVMFHCNIPGMWPMRIQCIAYRQTDADLIKHHAQSILKLLWSHVNIHTAFPLDGPFGGILFSPRMFYLRCNTCVTTALACIHNTIFMDDGYIRCQWRWACALENLSQHALVLKWFLFRSIWACFANKYRFPWDILLMETMDDSGFDSDPKPQQPAATELQTQVGWVSLSGTSCLCSIGQHMPPCPSWTSSLWVFPRNYPKWADSQATYMHMYL